MNALDINNTGKIRYEDVQKLLAFSDKKKQKLI